MNINDIILGVDIGHGGSDSGATFGNLKEKDINLEVGLKFIELLKLNGVKYVATRTTDVYVSLEERARILNEAKCTFVISIHHNAGGGHGFDLIHSVYHGEGEVLANLIAVEFKKVGQEGHGSRPVYCKQGSHGDYYFMIRATRMPTVISEFCFLDTDDNTIIDSPEERVVEAKALLSSVSAYIGVELITEAPQPKPQPQPVSNKVLAYQKLTRALGVTDSFGSLLVADGKAGARTRSTYSKMPVVKAGSKYGSVVMWIQSIVGADVDGAFGNQTKGKVIEYQRAHGLSQDGIVGQNSYRALVEG